MCAQIIKHDAVLNHGTKDLKNMLYNPILSLHFRSGL